MRFETLSIHAGQGPDPAYGAVMPPIYQVSTFAFEGVNKPGVFDYSRSGNPTRRALEDCLAALEGGVRGFAFGTGMAAEASALALLQSGDHIIVHDDLYGGTYRLVTTVTAKQGVDVEFVNLRDLEALRGTAPGNQTDLDGNADKPAHEPAGLGGHRGDRPGCRRADAVRQYLPLPLFPESVGAGY